MFLISGRSHTTAVLYRYNSQLLHSKCKSAAITTAAAAAAAARSQCAAARARLDQSPTARRGEVPTRTATAFAEAAETSPQRNLRPYDQFRR